MILDPAVAPEEAAAEAGLIYVHDDRPGISRKRSGKGFAYYDSKGNLIKDEKVLQRIRSLAIPPAYQKVWICPSPRGHLQATGIDAKGRKQYRYHPKFREIREEVKFFRMAVFGEKLPQMRQRMDGDLAKRGMPREKVLASIVYLLEKSLIRVGNEEYARTNRSFGLTTLRNRHVRIDGAAIEFRFVGKSGVKHQVRLADKKLARIVKKLQELPGQELFMFVDHDGNPHSINSSDVNAYIKEISGEPFTAKDFRTWAGTVLAFCELACVECAANKRDLKKQVTSVIKAVAAQLGNTPAVCRKSYVHPAVVDAFTNGILKEFLDRNGNLELHSSEDAEVLVLEFLRVYARESDKPSVAKAS